PRAEGMRDTLLAIAGIVEASGQQVLFDAATLEGVGLDDRPGYALAAIGKQADVAVVLGGDGTMLGIARELAPFRVPLIGINSGRLGFMTDIAVDQMPDVLAAMLAGQFERDERMLLDAEVRRNDQTLFATRALNDVVIARGVAGG